MDLQPKIRPVTRVRLVYALAAVLLTFIIGLGTEGAEKAVLATATIAVIAAAILFHLESHDERLRTLESKPLARATREEVPLSPRSIVTTEIDPGVFVTVVATPSGVAFEIEDQRHDIDGRFVGTVMSDAAARRLAASLDAAIKERASKPWGVQR